MHIRELGVGDAYVISPSVIRDSRGEFLESFRSDLLNEAVGHRFVPRQANTSVSGRGVIRGIHFADVPPGQAKYITASHGVVLDFVVDVRVGSPTFGAWDAVQLDTVDRRAVYVAEGIGHAFLALTEAATVNYLVSEPFAPNRERGIDPLDPEIGLIFPREIGPVTLSDKDAAAPSLSEARGSGLLPSFSDCRALYRSLALVGD